MHMLCGGRLFQFALVVGAVTLAAARAMGQAEGVNEPAVVVQSDADPTELDALALRLQALEQFEREIHQRIAALGLANLDERLIGLETDLVRLSADLTMNRQVLESRDQALEKATDRSFTTLVWLGALGSVVGGFLVVTNWFRDRQQHRDYELERRSFEDRAQRHRDDYRREREFYEARVLQAENRQEDLHQVTKEESIEKLGAVITLVEKAFAMRHEREEEQTRLSTQLSDANEIIQKLTSSFSESYKKVANILLPFGELSRMEWTRLSPAETARAAQARIGFESIPSFALADLQNESPIELAFVYQLLGVSAFYDNDVIAASKYLRQGVSLYDQHDSHTEHPYPRAFCSHYLGLIDKNWTPKGGSEGNLSDARRHLERANQFIGDNAKEVLTPLTLAEVLSYIDSARDEARLMIGSIVTKLERQKASAGLDVNQASLLGRAFLLQGNVEFLGEDLGAARRFYDAALKHSERNPFAVLSIAHVDALEGKDSASSLRRGLALLEDSGALLKQEYTVKVTALAWALIATTGEDAYGRFRRDFDELSKYVRPVEGRTPLFFSPISKRMDSFAELTSQLDEWV